MQDWRIIGDQTLNSRLMAYRELILSAEAGTGSKAGVRMPGGEEKLLGLRPQEGLDAAGALLGYVLLGREAGDVAEAMTALTGTEENRALARLCRLSSMMLKEDPGFMPASLLAGLRTAIALLPEGKAEAALPGLVGEKGRTRAPEAQSQLTARTAWAGDAAIVYFDLPEGIQTAEVDGKSRSSEECRAGICLPPGKTEVTVKAGDYSAVLQAKDPLRGVKFEAGFQMGSTFVPARHVRRHLWKRLLPCIRVSGNAGTEIPELQLVCSTGEIRHRAFVLEGAGRILSCPRPDPAKDTCLEIRGCGTRYLAINTAYREKN